MNNLKEKLERVSRLTETRQKEEAYKHNVYSHRDTEISALDHLVKMESSKGQLLKAMNLYKSSVEDRKLNRQEKYFDKLADKINQLNEDLNYLEEKVDHKSHLFEIKRKESEDLKKELKLIHKRIDDSKAEIRKKDKALIENEYFSEKCQTEIEGLRNELAEIEQELGTKTKGYDWQDELVKKLKKERDELKGKLDKYKEEFSDVDNIYQKNCHMISGLEVEINQLKEEKERVIKKSNECKISIKEKSLEIHDLKKMLNDFKRVLNIKSEEYRRVNNHYLKIFNEFETLEQSVFKHENAKKHLDSILVDKKSQVGTVEADILKLNKKLQLTVENCNSLKMELAEKDNLLSTLRNETVSLKDNCGLTERELNISREEYLEVSREFERVKNIHFELQNRFGRDQEEINRLKKECGEKKDFHIQIIKETEKLEKIIKDNLFELENLISENNELAENLTKMTVRRNELESKFDDVNSKLEIQRNREFELKEKVSSINKYIVDTQDQIITNEEEEIFYAKKIEALQSLIDQKIMMKDQILERKDSSFKITSKAKEEHTKISQKYEMLKLKEENEKKILDKEVKNCENLRLKIKEIESDIINTKNVITGLVKKRATVRQMNSNYQTELTRKTLEFDQIFDQDYGRQDSHSTDGNPPPILGTRKILDV